MRERGLCIFSLNALIFKPFHTKLDTTSFDKNVDPGQLAKSHLIRIHTVFDSFINMLTGILQVDKIKLWEECST